MDTPGTDRRRHPRSDLYHPIRFRLLSRDSRMPPIDGHLKDVSLGGARIGLDNRHGHLSRSALKGARTKLQITLAGDEPLQLISVVSWVKLGGSADEVEIGLEFSEMEAWQLEKIRLFLSLRHTDQTMFWNMWDSYQAGSR